MANLLLLPCPICGDPRPELRDKPYGGWGASAVYCPTCKSESLTWNTRAQSVLKWNTEHPGRSTHDIQSSLEARILDINERIRHLQDQIGSLDAERTALYRRLQGEREPHGG